MTSGQEATESEDQHENHADGLCKSPASVDFVGAIRELPLRKNSKQKRFQNRTVGFHFETLGRAVDLSTGEISLGLQGRSDSACLALELLIVPFMNVETDHESR